MAGWLDLNFAANAPSTSANTAPFNVTGGGGAAVTHGAESPATAATPSKAVFIAIAVALMIGIVAVAWAWTRKGGR